MGSPVKVDHLWVIAVFMPILHCIEQQRVKWSLSIACLPASPLCTQHIIITTTTTTTTTTTIIIIIIITTTTTTMMMMMMMIIIIMMMILFLLRFSKLNMFSCAEQCQ